MSPSGARPSGARRGVTAELHALCDARVRIPMRGIAQSFNVSISSAIILEHIRTRWPLLLQAHLADEAKERQLAQWLVKGIGLDATESMHVRYAGHEDEELDGVGAVESQ